MAHQIFDVDTAIAQRPAVLVGPSDFSGEGRDALEAGLKSSGTTVMPRLLHPAGWSTSSGVPLPAMSTDPGDGPGALRRCGWNTAPSKDASPDLDVDWLADGWVALLHKVDR